MNNDNENGGVGKAVATAGGSQAAAAGCRQSSTRWTPTTDQIRILKDLYYNYGIRSPSAEQIQRISAKLRQYGKIEGKNVFYWFQNHKARERQKKRFLSDPPPPQHQALAFQNCPNSVPISPTGLSAASSSSAPGRMAFGQMTNYGYNSVAMENKFRDFSVSTVGGSSVGGAPIGHNYGWITVDPYSTSCALFDKRVFYGESREDDEDGVEEEEEEEEDGRGMETLPLFPMHGDENINGSYCSNIDDGDHGWRNEVYMGASRTSLELTLNSYSNWGTPASP